MESKRLIFENKLKSLLRDARTYSNTRTENDHRLLNNMQNKYFFI